MIQVEMAAWYADGERKVVLFFFLIRVNIYGVRTKNE